MKLHLERMSERKRGYLDGSKRDFAKYTQYLNEVRSTPSYQLPPSCSTELYFARCQSTIPTDLLTLSISVFLVPETHAINEGNSQ